MARKEITLTIDKQNRDEGKRFIITEMSAWDAYNWASRVFFALLNAGAEIPDGFIQAGMSGLAAMTKASFAQFVFQMLAKVPHYAAKPILDDLMKCVKIQPGDDSRIVRELVDNDLEEISTILTLQMEAFKLHFDFFGGGGQSTMESENPETAA